MKRHGAWKSQRRQGHLAGALPGVLILLLAAGCTGEDGADADASLVDATTGDADAGPGVDGSGDAKVADEASKPHPKPPKVQLTSPGDGAVLHGKVAVEATAEAIRSHVTVVQVRFELDGVAIAVLTKAPWAWEWNTDNAAEGAHELAAVALDSAGTTAKAAVSLKIDRSGPSIAFSKPAKYALVNGDKEPVLMAVDVGESAPSEVAFSVKRGGAILKVATKQKAPWQAAWSTAGRDSGDWTLIATATDSKGMKSSTLRHVILDRAPTITLDKPAGGATVKGVVMVKATASDDLKLAELRIELNGKPLVGKAGTDKSMTLTASWDSATVPGGKHVLKASCVDSGGHKADVSVDVVVDQPLTAKLLACSDKAFGKCGDMPATNAPMKGTVGLKVVMVDDTAKPASATLKIDGKLLQELAKPPLQWLWDTTKTVDGPHEVTVKALNDNGDAVELSYAVSINNCDLDDDGHLSDTAICGGDDCDDNALLTHAGAKDQLGDGKDQNCDGVDGTDLDGDGWLSKASGGKDCDDGDKTVHPCVDDKADDGVDQDCDGTDKQGCDDCESCTLDAPGANGCVHLAFNDGSLCKDDNPCTTSESCSAGQCKAAKTATCDDNNPCTSDVCDGKGGCVNDKVTDGATCGDKKTCKAGVCG